MNSLVSVVIPVSRTNFIQKTIDSLSKQSYKNIEIILVVECNLKVKKNKKVKILHSNKNNAAYARNLGVRNARGEVIAFTDDDCIVPINWVELAVRKFSDYKSIELIYGPEIGLKKGKMWDRAGDLVLDSTIGCGFNRQYRKSKEGYGNFFSVGMCNTFIKKELFFKIGGFNEKIGFNGEDTEFALCASKFTKLYYLPNLAILHLRGWRKGSLLNYLKRIFEYGESKKLFYAYPVEYSKNLNFLMSLFMPVVILILLKFNLLFVFVLFLLYFTVILYSSINIGKGIEKMILPIIFLLHHVTYIFGVYCGLFNIWGIPKILKMKRI